MTTTQGEGPAVQADWTVTRTAEALARGQGITLTQLGERVGITKATMSRRVNTGGWKLTEVTKMAWALGYTANDLITGLNGALKIASEPRLVTRPSTASSLSNAVTDEYLAQLLGQVTNARLVAQERLLLDPNFCHSLTQAA